MLETGGSKTARKFKKLPTSPGLQFLVTFSVPFSLKTKCKWKQVTSVFCKLRAFKEARMNFAPSTVAVQRLNQGCWDTDVLIDYYLPCFDPCVLFFCLVFCSVLSSTELG